ncbi:MAG: phosphate ABC transporter permease subunit PstC [Pseudomonadota bacterium]
MAYYLIIALCFVALVSVFLGSARANSVAGGEISSLHSRPAYHGGFLAILTTFPALILVFLWSVLSTGVIDGIIKDRFSSTLAELEGPQVVAFMRDVRAMAANLSSESSQIILSTKGDLKIAAEGAAESYASLVATSNATLLALAVLLVGAGFFFGFTKIKASARTRHFVERFVMGLLIACSAVAILTTVGIVFSLVFESIRFFQKVPLFDFLFGYHWSPQSAFEAAGGGSLAEDTSRVFGAIPLFVGTFLITFIAISVAAPLGLMSAIYMSDYASLRFRAFAKPVLEILAGIPTVVYGFFAALTVAPAIRGWGEVIGLSVSSESALAAGLVMGIMIIPFVMSLSDDVINSVPQSLRDGSYAMGATKSETIRRVVLPAALPGIVSALLLAISRAVGETMIVVMAAGLAANLTINPLEAVTTVTVQIVTLLVGDQEFDSAKTLAAFALGLVLFVITLCLNVIALRVVQKYREQYD